MFPELLTPKEVATQMSGMSRFRTAFGSQRISVSKSLLKSARNHFYTIVPLIPDKFSCKNLLLFRFEVLGLILNTMTTGDNISHRNRDNFAQQIQMQLSQKPKSFSEFFFEFLKPSSNCQYSLNKKSPIA